MYVMNLEVIKLELLIISRNTTRCLNNYLDDIINLRRACAARVTVVVLCVCVCVCVCVYDYSRTTGYEAAYERYQQLQCYKGKKNNVAILLKRLRSRDMA